MRSCQKVRYSLHSYLLSSIASVLTVAQIALAFFLHRPAPEAVQAFVIQTKPGLTMITGCANPGIVEMTRKASEVGKGKIDLVMGGFHLSGASAATVRQVASGLHELGVARVAPCHCTGTDATALLATAFGERYQRCGVRLVLQEAE